MNNINWSLNPINNDNNGEDIEYIFRLHNNGYLPQHLYPINKDVSGFSSPETGWTDSPNGVNTLNPYEFISKRTRGNGNWSSWSEPNLWASFSKESTNNLDVNIFTPTYINELDYQIIPFNYVFITFKRYDDIFPFQNRALELGYRFLGDTPFRNEYTEKTICVMEINKSRCVYLDNQEDSVKFAIKNGFINNNTECICKIDSTVFLDYLALNSL